MSKEELYKALKIFNREDLTYENDKFFNDFEEYMNAMKQEKAIEVFMSTKDMIKYSKLEQEIERLNKELETLKQPQVFIDTQDMEERYGEELYKEYLEKENKRLNNIIKNTIKELFELKDMIYKPETREINFDVQRKISSMIVKLGDDKE